MSDDIHFIDLPAFVRPPTEFPPPSTTVQVTCGARSQTAPGHAINGDHYLICRLSRRQDTIVTSLPDPVIADHFEEYGYAMVVADGVGSDEAGQGASRLAIATLIYLVRQFGQWALRIDDAVARDIAARVEWFYQHVDGTVAYQRKNSRGAIGEATLTAAFSSGRDLFFAHVGHSRVYLLRDGRLQRLTHDHTLAADIADGVPVPTLIDVSTSAKDAEHILTATIGMRGGSGPVIDIERIGLVDDDRVLVCSNGLTDAVDDASIAAIIGTDRSPDEQCGQLIERALAANATDDVTALITRYRIPA